MNIKLIFAVMIGGGLGTGIRAVTLNICVQLFGVSFPWGTLFVNIVGSFFMGLIVAIATNKGWLSHPFFGVLTVGVLGGFTTFSSFSMDIFRLIEKGSVTKAFLYVSVSVLAGLAFLAVGYVLGKSLTPSVL